MTIFGTILAILLYFIVSRFLIGLSAIYIWRISPEDWKHGSSLKKKDSMPYLMYFMPIVGEIGLVVSLLIALLYPPVIFVNYFMEKKEEENKKTLAKERTDRKREEIADLTAQLVEKELDKEIEELKQGKIKVMYANS